MQLNLCVDPESLAADRFALQDFQTGNLLSSVYLRPNDQALQIRPFYWLEPFARVAPATLNLALVLQKELGGQLFLREKPLSEDFQSEIEQNIKGLGVEFFLFLEARKNNR